MEDDPGVRDLAAALLEETSLEVVEVESAEAALIFMQQRGGEVALVFADVRLSGAMDGLQMARAICQLWPTVKVVVTSGDPAVDIDGLPPCATFMVKSCLPRAIFAVVASSGNWLSGFGSCRVSLADQRICR